jgi:eukaryotic-like serine/threonine-protein kinase
LDLARLAVSDGRSRAAVANLKNLAQQADAEGRKDISVTSSVLLGEAMVKNKDYSAARQELQRALGRSEKLGLRLETARIHYLLGTALRLSGSTSEAPSQYRDAARMLDEIGKEQGAEHLLERFDLKTIYAESTQFSR